MYSPASDVWSFGVTVWEVVTQCSRKPFDEMSDDQVRSVFLIMLTLFNILLFMGNNYFYVIIEYKR